MIWLRAQAKYAVNSYTVRPDTATILNLRDFSHDINNIIILLVKGVVELKTFLYPQHKSLQKKQINDATHFYPGQ